MASKARDCRLALAPISISPDVLHAPRESWKGLYKFVPRVCRPIRANGKMEEKLQASVIDRYKRDTSYHSQCLEDFLPRFRNERPKSVMQQILGELGHREDQTLPQTTESMPSFPSRMIPDDPIKCPVVALVKWRTSNSLVGPVVSALRGMPPRDVFTPAPEYPLLA